MMFKNRNADLAKLDGKRFALNLDGVMTALSFVILFIVVIIPIFMIIYNAFCLHASSATKTISALCGIRSSSRFG